MDNEENRQKTAGMSVKEFARLGGIARAKKLGKLALKEHARKMNLARWRGKNAQVREANSLPR